MKGIVTLSNLFAAARVKNVNTVTSLMSKREQDGVRRELGNQKTGQHENTDGRSDGSEREN